MPVSGVTENRGHKYRPGMCRGKKFRDRMDHMVYAVHEGTDSTTIIFSGNIVMNTITRLEGEIIALTNATDKDMIVDLEKVDFIDSMGIGLFIRLSLNQKKRGGPSGS